MSITPSTSSEQVTAFWNRYFSVLRQFNVKEKSFTWYQRHIEALINTYPAIRLQAQAAENIQLYLEQLSRNPHIKDWQFSQKADALRLLFCHFLQLPWAKSFDWSRWIDDATHLESDHPTIMRTYEMIDKKLDQPDAYLGEISKDLYRKFLAAMRVPGYALNTTYRDVGSVDYAGAIIDLRKLTLAG